MFESLNFTQTFTDAVLCVDSEKGRPKEVLRYHHVIRVVTRREIEVERMGVEKEKKTTLPCHLAADITLLANKGHSCVPAEASRQSPQD